jgi:Tfp pilus assembly protein PilX
MVAAGGRYKEPDMMTKSPITAYRLPVKNEEGFVLVVALLALLIVTVIGVISLSTSTTEVMIAGNARLHEINFSGAESGLELSDPAIRFIVYNQPANQTECTNYSAIVNSCSNLGTELRTGPAFNSDSCRTNTNLQLTNFGGSMDVTVDIDRMSASHLAGSSIEFASGYEGIGMGAGGGGTQVYYRVNSVSRDTSNLGSESILGGIYRYVAY